MKIGALNHLESTVKTHAKSNRVRRRETTGQRERESSSGVLALHLLSGVAIPRVVVVFTVLLGP